MSGKMGVGSFANCELHDDVVVGKYSSIAEDVWFSKANDNHYCVFNRKCVYSGLGGERRREGIIIGNDVWIGRGARILPGVKINDGAIIGAYTVVAKEIPDYAVVVGNPAKIVRFRFDEKQRNKLKEIAWWDWDDETIKSRKKDMEDVDKFIKLYSI